MLFQFKLKCLLGFDLDGCDQSNAQSQSSVIFIENLLLEGRFSIDSYYKLSNVIHSLSLVWQTIYRFDSKIKYTIRIMIGNKVRKNTSHTQSIRMPMPSDSHITLLYSPLICV